MDLTRLLQRKVKDLGFKPSELPKDVRSAIDDISARAGADLKDGVPWHRCVTGVLAMMHEWHKAGDSSSSDYWMMQAMAQQFDLRIYHANDDRVVKADLALLLGQFRFLADPQRVPQDIMESYLETNRHTMKQILHGHLQYAQLMRRSLRDHLEIIAGYRENGWGAGKADVGHLIAILADRVGAQVGRPGETWEKLTLEDPEMAQVMQSASELAADMGGHEYSELRWIFPGISPYVRSPMFDSDEELLVESQIVKKQIQVHKHIASVQKAPFRLYMEKLLAQQRIDNKHQAARRFLEAVCRTADGLTVNVAMAKVVHIQMCIKNIIREGDHAVTWGNPFLALLTKFMFNRVAFSSAPKLLHAIRKVMPGMVDCLIQLHKWPHALDGNLEKWLPQATQVISGIMDKHARAARNQGISPQEHVRRLLDFPGMAEGQVDGLTSMFEEFWAAQKKEEIASASRPRTQAPHTAAAASPSGAPAKTGRAKGQPSRAKAKEAAADGSSKSAEAQTLSRHDADRAADVAGGASGKKLATQGQGEPVQDAQKAAQSQGGPSGPSQGPGKPEKGKADKMQQQAAGSQSAAQMAKAESMGSEKLEPSEGMGSASQQEPSAEAQDDEQPSEAAHLFSGSRFAALRSLQATGTPAIFSKEAASSSSSSVSPQTSLHLHDGAPLGQQEGGLPKPAAQAAQAGAPAAQDEGIWQEVRASRRKAASQQAALKDGACKAPGHGRSAPDQQEVALSPSSLRELQAAAQHAEQGLPRSEKAATSFTAQPVPAAAEHLPQWLPGLAGSKPQQPSQHTSPDTVLHPSSSPETPLHEQMAKANLSEEKHREDDDEELCVVCWEKAPEVLFYYCMHMCTCQASAKDIMAAGALCPMCRANIQSTVTTKF